MADILLRNDPYAAPLVLGLSNNGVVSLVGPSNALPIVSATSQPSGVTPLVGTVSTTTQTDLGPFTPAPNRAVNLRTSGTWQGSIRILSSTDGGATKLPLTAMGQDYGAFSTNVNEAPIDEPEAGVQYFVRVSLTSGSITVRMSH